jgi:hypothetical protein
MLENWFQRMQLGECSTLPVTHDGHLVGLLTSENVKEWMTVHTALANRDIGGNGHSTTVHYSTRAKERSESLITQAKS